jgi:hypothetical protein
MRTISAVSLSFVLLLAAAPALSGGSDPTPAMMTCEVRLEPSTIDLRPHEFRLSAEIHTAGFALHEVDLSTVRLDGVVAPDVKAARLGDCDRDGVQDLRLEFSCDSIHPWLRLGMNEIALTGELRSGETFRGIGYLRVVPPSSRKASVRILSRAGALPVRFAIDREIPSRHDVRIFDAQGRLVAAWSETLGGGVEGSWTGVCRGGVRAGAGVYFIRIEAGGSRMAGRAVILD